MNDKIPSKDAILDWINANAGNSGKRELAKAFGLKGSARIELKRLLAELESEGRLARKQRKLRDPDALPPVTVLRITEMDKDGDLFAAPLQWKGGAPPRILYIPKKGDPALAIGTQILAKLSPVHLPAWSYEARLIRKLGKIAQTRKVLGVFRLGAEGGRILPIDKGAEKEWRVARADSMDARDGELVEAEAAPTSRSLGLPQARITQRLGDPSAPRAVSLIAIHQHAIPDDFPEHVLDEASAMRAAGLEPGRQDLRHLPLVTIDPHDARDHDDAVFAETDPDNAGGFVLWVAIADVAHYVRPNSALDREARLRGNSTYFPDRVVPMLPDVLSGDLCSLHEGVDRACIVARMTIDALGNMTGATFLRGLMRSAASLTYEQVQAAIGGAPDTATAPLLDTVIRPLYGAYQALQKARDKRGPLELDLPERKVVLSDAGDVTSVAFKERLDAHRLIEEFMVLANVAAAETLGKKKTPLLYRIHEEPSPEKLGHLREVAQASGFVLAKGQVLHTSHINRLLAAAKATEFSELISLTALRSMTQAYYSSQNFGHFGLALRNYAHFTSPIRRYADVIVHRALIAAHGWGDDGLQREEIERLEETAKHISDTERRSMAAERDTIDRYLAAYLSDRIGNTFTGLVVGVQSFGVFVKLDETGADGLIPVRALGREYFHFDADNQTLRGAQTGTTISIGAKVETRLTEAAPITGGVILELLSIDGTSISRAKGGKSGARYAPRKPAKARIKERNTRR